MFKNNGHLFRTLLISTILLLFDISFCESQSLENLIIGGPCEYNEIPGIATIVSIKEPNPIHNNCRNSVEVLFNFVPDDPAVVYKFPSWEDNNKRFFVGDGKNPPLKWIQRTGIMEGNTYICLRTEQNSGACTPVLFKFPDIDTSGWAEDCLW